MSFARTTILAGLLSGGGAAGWTLVEYAMGWHNERLEIGAITGFVGLVFPILAIVLALGSLRRDAGGVLSWRTALPAGLAISAISAAIGFAFFRTYYSIINPQFVTAMRARGQAVDVDAQLAAVVAGSFVVGLLITVTTAMIMRRRGSPVR